MTLTSVGAILLLGTGHALAGAHGGIAPNPWMVWSYLAFGLSGVLWLLVLVLIPIQIKQLSLLRNPILGGLVAYCRLSQVSAVTGVLATLIALPPLYWMVVKTA